MTSSSIRVSADKTLNEVLSGNGNLISGLLALTLKYGIAPLACIFLGYVCLEQNKVIASQSKEMIASSETYARRSIDVVEKNTIAITMSTEVQKSILKSVEASNSRLEALERRASR